MSYGGFSPSVFFDTKLSIYGVVINVHIRNVVLYTLLEVSNEGTHSPIKNIMSHLL